VNGAGERVAPAAALRVELLREKPFACLLGPVGDLGPCRCVELAQERLVGNDSRTPN
jgi:hypothetical protein